MSKNTQPFVLYDNQIFDLQRFGGISRYFCEILRRLSIEKDIAVRYSINYYLTTYKLGKHRIPLPRFIFKHYRNLFHNKNKELSEKLLQENNNYLFHPTYYDPYFLKYIGKNPYIITVHDMIHEKFPSSFYNVSEIIAQKKEVITHASRIIAISENTKKDIIDLLHIAPEKIDVIYHSTSMKPSTGKQCLELPNTFLLFVGDRTPYKNFNRLVKAFAELSAKDKNLFLVCTGLPFKQSEKAFLDKLNISNKVIQIKATDKILSELYSRARLFVFPSLYEGFGIPVVEAMQMDIPVVVADNSSLKEIAEMSKLRFETHNYKQLNEILNMLYDNKEFYQKAKQYSMNRKKDFTWEKTALQYIKVFKGEISKE